MAKIKSTSTTSAGEKVTKGTSIGRGKVKRATMNKSKKRNYKKYRGQG